jgi:DNA primase
MILPAPVSGGCTQTKSVSVPPGRSGAIDLIALRERGPLLQSLVSSYLPLKRSGRQWIGCCPFHPDKTPSFTVYPDHFHCFGCGAHGDAIDFLQRIKGLTFTAACDCLGVNAGYRRPPRSATPKRGANNYATRLVREMLPLPGTLGERYIRKTRCLGALLPLPAEIGFHPGVPSRETNSKHPALIVPCFENEVVVRVQAVLLNPATGEKAALVSPKLTFGSGFSHVPVIFSARVAGDWILLTEGPEDAVVQNAVTGLRVDASLGSGSLHKLFRDSSDGRSATRADGRLN